LRERRAELNASWFDTWRRELLGELIWQSVVAEAH
jgi:hypothetical protein